MAIAWNQAQTARVGEALDAHPATSGRCRDAAVAITPVGRELDGRARSLALTPMVGRFVVPKQPVGGSWFHHYTTEVTGHCVDALTGSQGTECAAYLATHWQYDTAIRVEPADLARSL